MTDELKCPPRPRNGRRENLAQMAAAIWAAEAAHGKEAAAAAPPKPAPPPRRAKGEPVIDFHAVPPHHIDIDGRLRNWGIWCNSRQVASSSPMFRLAPSPEPVRREYGTACANRVDRSDAICIARAVTQLPEKHAAALNWCYVKPVSPRRACIAIGVTMEGLAELVDDGRQMLVNRLYR